MRLLRPLLLTAAVYLAPAIARDAPSTKTVYTASELLEAIASGVEHVVVAAHFDATWVGQHLLDTIGVLPEVYVTKSLRVRQPVRCVCIRVCRTPLSSSSSTAQCSKTHVKV